MKNDQLNKWSQPQQVDAVSMAFGGSMKDLLPPWNEIPSEFRESRTKWNDIQSRWFFRGLPEDTDWLPKDGVDLNKALGHLKSIQVSFEPKHEHKEAGVAWLMSIWFDDIVIPTEAAK